MSDKTFCVNFAYNNVKKIINKKETDKNLLLWGFLRLKYLNTINSIYS